MEVQQQASVRVLFEVVGGMLPPEVGMDMEEMLTNPETSIKLTGWQKPHPDPQFTRQWAITSDQWYAARDAGEEALQTLIRERVGEATIYAQELMAGGVNWVRFDWIYL